MQEVNLCRKQVLKQLFRLARTWDHLPQHILQTRKLKFRERDVRGRTVTHMSMHSYMPVLIPFQTV